MAHHGALCFGRNYEDTFAAAQKLEEACSEFLQNSYLQKGGSSVYNGGSILRYSIDSNTSEKQQPR